MAAETAASEGTPEYPHLDIEAELLDPPFDSNVTVDVLAVDPDEGIWGYIAKDILAGSVVSGPNPDSSVYVLPNPDHPGVYHPKFPSLHPRQFPIGPFIHEPTGMWTCLVFNKTVDNPAA